MKVDASDKELLSYVYHNHHQSTSEIARNTSLTRNQVEYRLRKYEDNGLIRKYFPVFDYAKLGYNNVALLLLKFEKRRMSKEFVNTLAKNKNTISYGETHNRYDLYLNCVFKDDNEINEFISNLFEHKNHYITDYKLIQPTHLELYPLKLFDHPQKEQYTLTKKKDKKPLDETDKKLLEGLAQDPRSKLLKLARKADVSVEVAHYRLKHLKEEFILGNRIQFNLEILGYQHSMVLLNFKAFSKENKKRLQTFAKNTQETQTLIFNVHKPHCMIQLLYQEEQTLRERITQIKELFNNQHLEVEILLIEQEHQPINPLPFL